MIVFIIRKLCPPTTYLHMRMKSGCVYSEDAVTVHETAAEALPDDANNVNCAAKLSEEAALIQRSFSQQVLKYSHTFYFLLLEFLNVCIFRSNIIALHLITLHCRRNKRSDGARHVFDEHNPFVDDDTDPSTAAPVGYKYLIHGSFFI